jgi:glycosyltransferase involved in cell wall biosynthesis
MKVILLTKTYQPKLGGTYALVKSMFDALKSKIDIRVYDERTNFLNLIKAIRGSDVCHFFGGWDFFHIFFTCAAFYMKKKVIIHPIGFYEPWSLNQKKIKKKLALLLYQRKILQKADFLYCSSETEKKNLLKLDHTFKTRVLPFGIPSVFFNKKIKKKLNKKAIFFSRIHYKKGLDDLITQWIQINNQQWTLDVYGPCDDLNYYNSLLSIIKKNKNIKINFFKPVYGDKKKISLFKNYDFFILPTKNDTFALAVAESLACGLPVLTKNNPPWQSIKKNNAGWYVSDSSLVLNRTIKKIFKFKSNDFFIKAKNAYNLAQQYNWKSLSEKYIKGYFNLFNYKKN